MHFVFLICMTELIELKTEEPIHVPTLAGRNFRICPDGTFLILNVNQAFHFDAEGNLLHRLGRSGQGPGEFTYLSTGFWDGKRYVFYTAGNKLVYFNGNGEFEKEIKTDGHLMRIGWTGKSFFGYHTGGTNALQKPHKGMVLLDRLDDLERLDELLHFHTTSEGVLKFNYNQDNHWAAQVGNEIFVADEMTPTVWVYDITGRLTRKISLQLLDFIPSPAKWFDRRGKSLEWRRKWYFSWSRLVGFYAREGAMLVAYEVPDDQNPQSAKVYTGVYDLQGNPIARISKTRHEFMDSDSEHYYLFQVLDSEEELLPKYAVEVRPW